MRFSELKIPDGMELVIVVRPGYDHLHLVLQVQPEKGDVALADDTRLDLNQFELCTSKELLLQHIVNQLWHKIEETIRLTRYDPSIRPT